MRARVITLSLLGVLVFVLGGLVLVDRLLARQDQHNARSDARLAAEVLGEYVRTHVVALTAFHGVVVDAAESGSRDRERFLGAATTLGATGGAARGFRRVWVMDSAGVVQNEYVFGGPSTLVLAGWDLDTVAAFGMRELMAAARRTRRPIVSRGDTLFSGRRGVVIVRPIVAGERVVGFAGGSIRGDAFIGALPESYTAERDVSRLMDASGVIATVGPRDARAAASAAVEAPIVVRERVPVPGATPWTLVMGYEAPSARLRTLAWLLGLTVMAVLTRTLLHERRQAIRIADRSAELERLSGELLAANRAKSEFLANISHELRTPLNAIVGFADLLREGVYGELNTRQAGPVQRIEASATHLRQLVDQILDLAKITAGRLEVHVEPIDLRPFVLDVASEVEPLINEKGLSLSIAVGATLSVAGALMQALTRNPLADPGLLGVNSGASLWVDFAIRMLFVRGRRSVKRKRCAKPTFWREIRQHCFFVLVYAARIDAHIPRRLIVQSIRPDLTGIAVVINLADPRREVAVFLKQLRHRHHIGQCFAEVFLQVVNFRCVRSEPRHH